MHKVIYGKGAQPLRFVPRDADGRAWRIASATYKIVDLREPEESDEREVVASTATTLGSESTTTDTACGPAQVDPTELSVVDASGFATTEIGRKFIVSEDGRVELFTLDQIDSSNDLLYATAPLRRDFSSGASVLAVEHEGTFPLAEANDEDNVEDGGGPYLIIWDYTIDGRPYSPAEEVWVVRYSALPLVDEADIIRADPRLATRARGEYDLASAAGLANEDFEADVRAAGRDPSYFLSNVTAKVACRERACFHAYRWFNTETDDDRADRHDQRYQKLMNDLLEGLPPEGSVDINPVTDTAPSGSSEAAGERFIRRS